MIKKQKTMVNEKNTKSEAKKDKKGQLQSRK